MKFKKVLSAIAAAAIGITAMFSSAITASAATIDDVKPIKSSITYWFDDATSSGTVATTANTVFGDYFFTSTGNSKAANKGSHVIDGVTHLNSLRVKNVQDKFAIDLAVPATIKVYTQSHGTRGLVVSTTDPTTAYTSATTVGGEVVYVEPASTTEAEFTVDTPSKLYFSSYGGDFFLAGIVVSANTTEPSISLDKSKVEKLPVGDSVKLTATTDNADGATVVWSASNTNATVEQDGTVTGVTAGDVTITATITVGGTDYKASCDVTVVEERTVTYAIGEGTGIVPPADTVALNSSITLPKNTTMYVEGKTLTGWTDGTNTYAPGAAYTVSEDKTLTAVFTENAAKLGDEATEVTFTFMKNEGAPEFEWQGDVKFLVAQATIGSAVIDVKLDVDTTSGKLNNTSWTDWAQVGNGTKFSVPVLKDSVVSVTRTFNADEEYTINGVAKTGYEGQSETMTADGTCEIVAVAKCTYWRGIKVTYPKVEAPVSKVETITYENTDVTAENPAAYGFVTDTTTTADNAVSKITWTVKYGDSFTKDVVGQTDTAVSGGTTVAFGLIITSDKPLDEKLLTVTSVVE